MILRKKMEYGKERAGSHMIPCPFCKDGEVEEFIEVGGKRRQIRTDCPCGKTAQEIYNEYYKKKVDDEKLKEKWLKSGLPTKIISVKRPS